jgi:hypothetical protein
MVLAARAVDDLAKGKEWTFSTSPVCTPPGSVDQTGGDSVGSERPVTAKLTANRSN